MTLLWIDDLRDPNKGWAEKYAPAPYNNVVWAKNYDEVINFLNTQGLPDMVCFDHDLGEVGENERNGFTCCKAIVDYCFNHDCDIPLFNIQSSNPVGAENIRSLMNQWHRVYLSRH